jgi:hypothetical protein
MFVHIDCLIPHRFTTVIAASSTNAHISTGPKPTHWLSAFPKTLLWVAMLVSPDIATARPTVYERKLHRYARCVTYAAPAARG